MKTHYQAPWCIILHLVSWFVTATCIVTSVVGAGALRRHGWSLGVIIANALPPALILGAALCTVRQYIITPGATLVKRLLWTTTLPLKNLQSVALDPGALRGSIRLLGNGGIFSFTGWYWNRRLRSFRAFVTHPKKCVVLHFKDHRVILSPASPDDFVQTLRLQHSSES